MKYALFVAVLLASQVAFAQSNTPSQSVVAGIPPVSGAAAAPFQSAAPAPQPLTRGLPCRQIRRLPRVPQLHADWRCWGPDESRAVPGCRRGGLSGEDGPEIPRDRPANRRCERNTGLHSGKALHNGRAAQSLSLRRHSGLSGFAEHIKETHCGAPIRNWTATRLENAECYRTQVAPKVDLTGDYCTG